MSWHAHACPVGGWDGETLNPPYPLLSPADFTRVGTHTWHAVV